MAARTFQWKAPEQTNVVVSALRALRPGKYRLELCADRPRRSDRQNRYYWPCVVVPFAEWLTEQYGETVTQEQAHDILKDTYLRLPVVNADGEVKFNILGDPAMRTRSTTELDTAEFAQYVENCRDLLRDLCNIDVPDPDPDYDLKPRKKVKAKA